MNLLRVFLLKIKGVSCDWNSLIGKNCRLHRTVTIRNNSIIGDNVIIDRNVIIDKSWVGNGCKVGPFSHIHSGSIIQSNTIIGNFVEIDNSLIGERNKIKHHVYAGHTKTGEKVNFGAGVITCNYDGKKKNFTKIGKNVFIGSNSNIIAPITIQNNCFIAAGTTVTDEMPTNTFAISRVKQKNKSNKL